MALNVSTEFRDNGYYEKIDDIVSDMIATIEDGKYHTILKTKSDWFKFRVKVDLVLQELEKSNLK